MNKTLNPMRVLMAEDDHVTALGIKAGLQGLGHTVVGHAPNGKIAIQMVQELSPEIILMDIEMPEMDGLEATQWVQANCPRPVVLLTSREEPEMVNRASQIGAGAYLVKPPARQKWTGLWRSLRRGLPTWWPCGSSTPN